MHPSQIIRIMLHCFNLLAGEGRNAGGRSIFPGLLMLLHRCRLWNTKSLLILYLMFNQFWVFLLNIGLLHFCPTCYLIAKQIHWLTAWNENQSLNDWNGYRVIKHTINNQLFLPLPGSCVSCSKTFEVWGPVTFKPTLLRSGKHPYDLA